MDRLARAAPYGSLIGAIVLAVWSWAGDASGLYDASTGSNDVANEILNDYDSGCTFSVMSRRKANIVLTLVLAADVLAMWVAHASARPYEVKFLEVFGDGWRKVPFAHAEQQLEQQLALSDWFEDTQKQSMVFYVVILILELFNVGVNVLLLCNYASYLYVFVFALAGLCCGICCASSCISFVEKVLIQRSTLAEYVSNPFSLRMIRLLTGYLTFLIVLNAVHVSKAPAFLFLEVFFPVAAGLLPPVATFF